MGLNVIVQQENGEMLVQMIVSLLALTVLTQNQMMTIPKLDVNVQLGISQIKLVNAINAQMVPSHVYVAVDGREMIVKLK